jgi:chromosomal replication initiation ATPase DnaA
MYMVRHLCDRSLKEIVEIFSLESYGSIGWGCGLIERRIRYERMPRRHIEEITEMVSSISIQKKS